MTGFFAALRHPKLSRCSIICAARMQHENRINSLGSLPPLAAFAHRKNWIVALNVCFLQAVQYSLQTQRKSAFRPS
jgi:hypothetical protein